MMLSSSPMSPFEKNIIMAVQELQGFYAKVHPWVVRLHLGEQVSERQMRRYMTRLARDGWLDRQGERSGYNVTPRQFRMVSVSQKYLH